MSDRPPAEVLLCNFNVFLFRINEYWIATDPDFAPLIGMNSTKSIQCTSFLNRQSHSLSNAEILKNMSQYLMGGDFTGNFTQVVQTFADILSQKIAGNARVEAG